MREGEFWAIQARRRLRGGPEKDPEPYVSWRELSRPENVALLDFWGRYLRGQCAGMSDALNILAVRFAFELDETPRALWPELTERLIYVHALISEQLQPADK